MGFKNESEVRKNAVYNLVVKHIDSVICIGGDGSLTGMDVLRRVWKFVFLMVRNGVNI